uniref:Uncharacterized protein n=1 Tax=Picea glauca TaxID=3330 RepID=A0A124GNZ9_PICGL|nr:hypothetical protein ABT39_MTgene219 [Picea glauca]
MSTINKRRKRRCGTDIPNCLEGKNPTVRKESPYSQEINGKDIPNCKERRIEWRGDNSYQSKYPRIKPEKISHHLWRSVARRSTVLTN